MTTLSLILVAVLAMVLAAASAPVGIRVTVSTTPPHTQASGRWLWWSWGPTGGVVSATPDRPSSPASRARARRRSATPGWRRARAAFGTPGFPSRLVRLGADVARVATPTSVEIRARIGFDDPAETGRLAGALAACAAIARGRTACHDRWAVRVDPDFETETSDVRASVEWSIRPAAALWPVCAFVASPVTWRAAGRAWKAR